MDKKKKELLHNYMGLDPANQADVSAYIRIAYVSQENTKKAMSSKYAIPYPETEKNEDAAS